MVNKTEGFFPAIDSKEYAPHILKYNFDNIPDRIDIFAKSLYIYIKYANPLADPKNKLKIRFENKQTPYIELGTKAIFINRPVDHIYIELPFDEWSCENELVIIKNFEMFMLPNCYETDILENINKNIENIARILDGGMNVNCICEQKEEDEEMKYLDCKHKKIYDLQPNLVEDGLWHDVDLSDSFPEGLGVGSNKLLYLSVELLLQATERFHTVRIDFRQAFVGSTQPETEYNLDSIQCQATIQQEDTYLGKDNDTVQVYCNEDSIIQYRVVTSGPGQKIYMNTTITVRGALVNI